MKNERSGQESGVAIHRISINNRRVGLFQADERWIGLAAIGVGLLLVFSSQTMHVEREEVEDLKKEVSELKGR